MNALPLIVVVDHEGVSTRILLDSLRQRARIVGVTTIPEAELTLRHEPASVLVCRDDLPGETGIMFLTRYRDIALWQRRILLCPPIDSELALFLINETNLFRCVQMPPEPALLVQIVEAALHESERIKSLLQNEIEIDRLRRHVAAKPIDPAQLTVSWLKAVPRLATIVLFTFTGIFALGVVTLLLLYLLKSVLGIDLIPGAHLSDALR